MFTKALRQCHRLGRDTRLPGSKCRLNIRRRSAGRKPRKPALCFWRTTAKAPVKGLGAFHRNWRNATNHTTSRATQGSATGCAGKPLTKAAFALTKALHTTSGSTSHSTRAGALSNPRAHPGGTGHISRTSSRRSPAGSRGGKTRSNGGRKCAGYFKGGGTARKLFTILSKIGPFLGQILLIWSATKK